MATAHSSSMEIWKQAVGWENWYSVSDWGRVRRDAAGKSTWAGRILKSWLDGGGYPFVVLCKPGKKRTCSVHTLVAAAFLGPRPKGFEINHKNTNKLDNRLENLEYITHDRNMKHAAACGLMPRGDQHYSRTHPERLARGNRHWSRLHPERVARGDRHGSRLHPESRLRGEQNGSAKLTDKDVLEIRKLLAEGVFQEVVAEKFGVSRTTVSYIKTGKTWAHVVTDS